MISIVVSGEVSVLWVGDFEGIYLLMEKLRGSLPTSSLVDKYEVEPNARAETLGMAVVQHIHHPW